MGGSGDNFFDMATFKYGTKGSEFLSIKEHLTYQGLGHLHFVSKQRMNI